MFVPTDRDSFPRTMVFFTRTMRYSWERTIVRSHGQLFVPVDNYPFPRIIIRLHGELDVRGNG